MLQHMAGSVATGLGSDGVLELTHREGARAAVTIWNPDGSEAERSGNGLRIAAKFLSDHGYTIENSFVIETVAGPVNTQVYRKEGRVYAVRLEMGSAKIDRSIRDLEAGKLIIGQTPNILLFLGERHGHHFLRERR